MPNQYVNKVIINDVTKLDLTGDTVLASDVRSGISFHLASGEPSVGTASLSPQITAVNYSVLPATGRQNDIALINGQTVTSTVVSTSEPTTPSEGMVWIKTANSGSVYIELGNTKVVLASMAQYVNSMWVNIGEWYVHNGTNWVRGRSYLWDSNIGAVDGVVWRYNKGTSASVTIDDTSNPGFHLITAKGASNTGGHTEYSDFADVTNFSKLYVEIESKDRYTSISQALRTLRIGTTEDNSPSSTGSSVNFDSGVYTYYGTFTKQIVSADISSVSGSRRIAISGTTDRTIYNVYLE